MKLWVYFPSWMSLLPPGNRTSFVQFKSQEFKKAQVQRNLSRLSTYIFVQVCQPAKLYPFIAQHWALSRLHWGNLLSWWLISKNCSVQSWPYIFKCFPLEPACGFLKRTWWNQTSSSLTIFNQPPNRRWDHLLYKLVGSFSKHHWNFSL